LGFGFAPVVGVEPGVNGNGLVTAAFVLELADSGNESLFKECCGFKFGLQDRLKGFKAIAVPLHSVPLLDKAVREIPEVHRQAPFLKPLPWASY
jgi:hypothetical protein